MLDAAFRRCGVLRVDRIAELFSMAEVLAKQPRPAGAAPDDRHQRRRPRRARHRRPDRRRRRARPLSAETIEALDALLPAHWSHDNPIDVLGDAGPDRYAKALEVAAQDPNTDGLLVILTPQAMTDPTQTAERLKAYARIGGQAGPGQLDGRGRRRGRRGDPQPRPASRPSPTPTPPPASSTPCGATADNLRGLYETPTATDDSRRGRAAAATAAEAIGTAVRGRRPDAPDRGRIQAVARRLRHPDRRDARRAATRGEAVAAADALGYPVVLKLHSETITHKTDVGGVRLNLADADAVRRAYRRDRGGGARASAGAEHFLGVTVQPMVRRDGYELIVGSSLDPQFGPVLLFGSGGQLVEVFKDRALALPPLNTTLARRMMEQTRIYAALKGVRGRDAGRPRGAGAAPGPVQPARRRAALDQGDRHQPAARLAATDSSRSTPAWSCTAPEVGEDQLPGLAIRPYPDAVRRSPGPLQDGTAVADPPDPPGGRAADGPVPRDALGAERLLRYFHAMKLEPARRARAADADLLHRLRPRDGAGGRPPRPGRPGAARSSASAA